jgi:hypothetical protein
MADESLNPNIDQNANEAEAIARLFEDDYFKLKVEQEVRLRTQAELDAWWKRLISIAAVIVTIIGLFGVKEYFSFQSMITDEKALLEKDRMEFQKKNEQDMLEAKARAKRSDDIVDEKATMLDKKGGQVADILTAAGLNLARLEGTALAIQEQQKTNNESVKTLSDEARERGISFAEKFATQTTELKNKANNVEKLQGVLTATLNENEKKLSTFEGNETARKAEVNTKLNDFENLKTDIAGVKDKLYGGASYVLLEKSQNPIRLILGDPNSPDLNKRGKAEIIKIQVYRVHRNDISGLKIIDEDGNILVDRPEVRVNESIKFPLSNYVFTMTLRYVTELPFRSDQAGVDLRWEKSKAPEPLPIESKASLH